MGFSVWFCFNLSSTNIAPHINFECNKSSIAVKIQDVKIEMNIILVIPRRNTITPLNFFIVCFLAGHFKLMHRKSYPDVDSLTRCCSETRQFYGACGQFKTEFRETNMSASLIRRGLELFNDDFKGRSTVWGAKVSSV